MISTSDIQRLIQHESDGREILSLYLDMSVTSDNKRTHQQFLNKEKSRFTELESDRDKHHRVPLGATLARAEDWISTEFDPTNKGIAIFAEIGGSWFAPFQLPIPVRNRLEIAPLPVIGPLSAVVHQHPRYGIISVDREHLRLIAYQMHVILEESRVDPDALPIPHDVQAGGYSHKDYQRRKAEETKHFFKDFVDEIQRFDQRCAPDQYVLLGTVENAKHFRDFLPKEVTNRLIHTDASPIANSTASEILRTLRPVFEDHARRNEAAALNLLQDRARESHFATTGVHETLFQLQEGKVETLVLARDLEKEGVQCTQCSFYLVRRDGACPYCGGELRNGVDLVESMIRIAANQDIDIEFVAADTMHELNGIGALLKF
jgi:peptide subunit release factor 1 (eRF1)